MWLPAAPPWASLDHGAGRFVSPCWLRSRPMSSCSALSRMGLTASTALRRGLASGLPCRTVRRAPIARHPAMPAADTNFAAQLLARAPDPFGTGARPATVAAWLAALSAAGIEGAAGDVARAAALDLSADQGRRAEVSAASSRMEGQFQRACAAEALGALRSAAIPAAQLKGTGLADRVYPSHWVRRATDVDLIVRPADLDPALAALAAIGYREAYPARAGYYRRHHHDVPLHRDLSPPLDLHAAGLAGLGTSVPASDLLVGDGALHPAAEVVHLAAHAATHLFERPVWVLDLALAVAATGLRDVGALDAIADRWHVRRAWRLARIVVRQHLGPDALPWPAPEPTAADRLALTVRLRYLSLPARSARRFAAFAAGGWACCDTVSRAARMAQFSVLRAAGDLATGRGVPVPANWPPWLGRPQS